MPAKKQVTKEMILGAALRVLMEGGTEAVNVKSLAAELGCSTQPIYLSFDNMDALRKELIPTAVNKFVELMQKECGSTRVHLYGIEYICLARQQPELFRFLFMRSQAFAEMKQVLSVTWSQRHQHHKQHLYTSGFLQQSVFCQCHCRNFPREHKSMRRSVLKRKAAQNLSISSCFLVPMVGVEPTRYCYQ